MSQAFRSTGPAVAEALADDVREVLTTPSITVVDRVGPLLIIGQVEVDPDVGVRIVLQLDLMVSGVGQGLVLSRQASNPVAGDNTTMTFAHVILNPNVGDTYQLEVRLFGNAGVAQANRSSLVVVSLGRDAAEVAGLVSP